jgi:hypothetical protein
MIEKLRQIIEWQALELIKRLSEIGKMTQEQAQTLAKHVLDCISPNMSAEDFFKGVFKLDDGFPELAFIVVPLATKYREKIELPTTDFVKKLIESAKYDEAVNMAQKLVNQDMKIKIVAKGGKK